MCVRTSDAYKIITLHPEGHFKDTLETYLSLAKRSVCPINESQIKEYYPLKSLIGNPAGDSDAIAALRKRHERMEMLSERQHRTFSLRANKCRTIAIYNNKGSVEHYEERFGPME